MKTEFAPARLDVNAFAASAAVLSAGHPLQDFPRLAAELAAPAPEALVRWKAVGEQRPGASGAAVPWLHLSAEATMALVCQRCLAPVDVALQVDRWFRFVADEATAEAEDEEAEEDVLVASRDFDLLGLIEDELLMEIPVTPVHEVCPEPVQLSSSDADFEEAEAAKPNPFAVLDSLRSRKPK